VNDPRFDEYEKIKREASNGSTGSIRFPLVPFNEIKLDRTPAYLVRGLLPREGLIVVWGPPKCGKTFWMFDLMMSIALGWEYRGRRVKQGTVVYVACEGERGLAARAEAFCQRKLFERTEAVPFYLLTTRLDLVDEHAQLIHDISVQLNGNNPVAIVVDTLNRSFRGSESSDEDVGAYVKAADAIRGAFKCAVCIVHHCGIDDKRPRGHTSLTGAVDAQIAVRRDKTDIIRTTVEWMKDGLEGDQINSVIDVVELGNDEDEELITSFVIEPSDAKPESKDKTSPKSSVAQRAGLKALRDCIGREGKSAPTSDHIPAGVMGVTLDYWREHLANQGILNVDGNPRQEFKRIRLELIERGVIGVWENFVWIVT
jgi:AAA domain